MGSQPRKILLLLLLGMVGCGLPLACFAGEDRLGGDWAGTFNFRGSWVFFTVHFRAGHDSITGTADMPSRGRRGIGLSRVLVRGSEVEFALPGTSAVRTFRGRMEGDTIVGDMEEGGVRGSFRLARVSTLDNYVGDYQFDSKRLVSVVRFQFGGGDDHLAYFDSESGHWGFLHPAGRDSFVFVPARYSRYRWDLKVTFLTNQDRQVTGLRVRQPGSPVHEAQPVKLYSEEEVSFRNGRVTLAGSLVKPLTPGPHPAVIFLHSSGAQARDGSIAYNGFIARHFARHGIAALIYDKRGVGASTGSWLQADFDDLAGDGLAAVRFLQGRSDIKPGQIGFWGLSQGGWLAPLAGARFPEAAFVVMVAGPVVSPERQAIYRTEHLLREDGFSANEVAQALAHTQLIFDFIRGNANWHKLQASVEKARRERWAPYVMLPQSPDDLSWWHPVYDFDPAAVLKKLSCPLLAIFGGRDQDVPTQESTTKIESVFKQMGKDDYTVKVFPDGDHFMLVQPAPGYPSLAPGYLRLMVEWIHKQVGIE